MGDPSPPLYETVACMIGYKFTRGMHNHAVHNYTVHICVQHLILDIIIQKFSLFHRQNTFMVYYVLTVHVAATKSVLLLVVEKNVG